MTRPFRLVDGPNGLGLSCTVEGLWLAGAPLLRRSASGFAPRPKAEIDALLKGAYSPEFEPSHLFAGLEVVASALNRGDLGRAMVGALHLQLAEPTWDGAIRLTQVEKALAKYDPNEPRDWHGRWTTSGDGGANEPAASDAPAVQTNTGAQEVNPDTLTPADYNGYFHDEVVADYANYLRSRGEIVLNEVRLKMADRSFGARLDILALDPVTDIIYGVDMKTGDRPSFTDGQLVVYPHLMWGGAVIALDAKTTKLGILPGVPLGPIPLFEGFQLGRDTQLHIRPLKPENMSRYYRGEIERLLRNICDKQSISGVDYERN